MLLEEHISRKQALFMAPIAPEELKNEATRYYGKWKYGMELKTGIGQIGLYKEPSLSPLSYPWKRWKVFHGEQGTRKAPSTLGELQAQ